MWLATNSGPFVLREVSLTGLGFSLKVLHISDIHFAPRQHKKAAFLKDIASTKPDLVVNTGDNLGHKQAINPLLQVIEPLLDFPGVFVNGSNDYFSPSLSNPLRYLAGPSRVEHKEHDLDTERMTREFENAGWLNLNNQVGELQIAGSTLSFTGVDDPHLRKELVQKAKGENLIAVSHAPYLRVLDAFAEQKAKVIFAGHTHGGQICLPVGRALITNCDLPAAQAQGLSRYSDSWLHVSGGMGANIYTPLRLFCPPSATLIKIS
jgi:predicted MPP superfamily phosphohydrolase